MRLQRHILATKALAVLAASALLVAGCSSSASIGSRSQSVASPPAVASATVSPTQPVDIAANKLRCVAAPAAELATIKTALQHSAHDLTNGISVTIRPGATIVAARLVGSTNDDIGTWFYASGEVDAINTAARTYSAWRAATQPGSQAAKQRAALLASPAEAKAVKCVNARQRNAPTAPPQPTTAYTPPPAAPPQPTTAYTPPPAATQPPAPSAAMQCTQTASGSCIRGGEFCRRAQYGQQGTDAEGRTYTCTGSQEHPHWE